MKWLRKALPELWELGIFVTGLGIAWTELAVWAVLGRTPDPGLLGFAGMCLIPAARRSVKAVLGSGDTGPSSEPPPPPSSPSSSSSGPPEGGAGEPRG